MWICLAEFPQTLHTEFVSLWLTHIKSNLMLYIFPVIDNGIVHMYRIPHDISQKTYGIIMERNGRSNGHISCLFGIRPVIAAYHFTGCTVNNFPPASDVIMAVYFQHFRINSAHQMNGKCIRFCSIELCHNIALLNLIRICFCPLIVLSCCIISRIYFRIYIL